MKRLLVLLITLTPLIAAASATDEIKTVLNDQAAAWNRGDIDAFMEYYWNNDSLRFASGGTISRGWLTTLDRYHKSYPDRAAMGTLSFSDLEITELAPDAAIAFGRWMLIREHDSPHGLFTLTFRKIDGKWVITQDHTSSGG